MDGLTRRCDAQQGEHNPKPHPAQTALPPSTALARSARGLSAHAPPLPAYVSRSHTRARGGAWGKIWLCVVQLFSPRCDFFSCCRRRIVPCGRRIHLFLVSLLHSSRYRPLLPLFFFAPVLTRQYRQSRSSLARGRSHGSDVAVAQRLFAPSSAYSSTFSFSRGSFPAVHKCVEIWKRKPTPSPL